MINNSYDNEEKIILPIDFINKYLTTLPNIYFIVFIFTYSKYYEKKEEIQSGYILKSLNITLQELEPVLDFWAAEGFMQLKGDCVEYIGFDPHKDEQTKSTRVIIEKKPVYSPAELDIYVKNSKEVKQLFASAQENLGKMLSYSDMSVLFSLYDWLGLSMEVIEILIAYCIQNNHRNMRYIEKVAIDWAESGITTAQNALSRIKLFNKDYKTIMRAMGQYDRTPVAAEEKFINKWITECKMPIELIKLACEKTVMSTGKASFKYADTIITNWHNNGVKSEEDIARLDNKFTRKTESKKKEPKKNRFVNYEQREWDFEELNKMESEYIKRKLEENS